MYGKKVHKKLGVEGSLISHTQVFGSIAYAHVPDQKRQKLDDKSEKYVFISYDSSLKGCKLYNPSNGKVILSKDVVFDEESTWDWNVQEVEHYNFFPPIEGEMQPRQEPISPPRSPNHEGPSSSLEESLSKRPHYMRSLQELYEMNENQMISLYFVSLPIVNQ